MVNKKFKYSPSHRQRIMITELKLLNKSNSDGSNDYIIQQMHKQISRTKCKRTLK